MFDSIIVSGNSKNGKSLYSLSDRHKEISFQVYENTDSHKHDKSEVRRLCNVLRDKSKRGFSFKTIKGVDKLIEILNSGKSIHYGITYKTCLSADVEYFAGCFIDYDCKEKSGELIPGAATTEQLLNLKTIQKYVSFYQPSSKGLPNAHFHVNYDRDCSYDEHVMVIKTLVQLCNEELSELGITVCFDSCVEGNSNNLCYASKSPCKILDNDLGLLIPVDEFLTLGDEYGFRAKTSREKRQAEKIENKIFGANISNESLPPESKKFISEETVTEKFLKHVKKEFFAKNPESWFGDFYDLYPHKFKDFGVKAKGCNPFSATNDSGESFVLFDDDEDLPPRWHDGTKSTTETTLIEYFYRLGRLAGKYQNVSLKNGFKTICFDICQHFDIPQFSFSHRKVSGLLDTVNSLMFQICEDLRDVLYIVEWGTTSKDNTIIFYYKNGDDIFVEYCLKKLALKLKDYVNKTYPYFDEQMQAKMADDKKFKYKGLVREMENWFQNNQSPLKVLKKRPFWDVRYIPFVNGLYDTIEKKLIPNDGRAFNTGIIECEYFPISDDNPGVLALKNWLNTWMPETHKHGYILNYLKICAQGRANEITNFPCIYGKRGTGKSTLGSVAASIFPSDLGLTLIDSKQPLNPSNNHGEAELENKFLWTVTEIGQTAQTSMDKILSFFGQDNKQTMLSINPKNQETRQSPKWFGLIADSEKIPQMPKSKGGYYRRFVFIESRYAPEVVEFIKIVKQYAHEVYCWLIQQNFDDAKTELNECLSNPYFAEKAKEVQKENSDLDQFIDRCFEVSNEENDKHSGSDLFNLYMQWCSRENMKALDSRVFAKYFKSALEDFDWVENTTRSNGKTVYRGFKLRSDMLGYQFGNGCPNDF